MDIDNQILETKRLYLRKIEIEDSLSISLFLKDPEVMYAWEHAFSDEEVTSWIKENIRRYKHDGFSYWAVIEKKSNQLIGVAGIIKEQVEKEIFIGIGYIFGKEYWHKGYAYESASACLSYGFETLKLREITAQIRPENLASIKVAEKLGMKPKKEFIKNYKGKNMRHILYGCMEE